MEDKTKTANDLYNEFIQDFKYIDKAQARTLYYLIDESLNEEREQFLNDYNKDDITENKTENTELLIFLFNFVIDKNNDIEETTKEFLINNSLSYMLNIYATCKLTQELKAVNLLKSFCDYIQKTDKDNFIKDLSRFVNACIQYDTEHNDGTQERFSIFLFIMLLCNKVLTFINELHNELSTDPKQQPILKNRKQSNNIVPNVLNDMIFLQGKENKELAIAQYQKAHSKGVYSIAIAQTFNNIDVVISTTKTKEIIALRGNKGQINKKNYINASKVLQLFFQKLNDTNLLKNDSKTKIITIDLKELVNLGVYSNTDIAREDIKGFVNYLGTQNLNAYNSKNDYDRAKTKAIINMFTSVMLDDNKPLLYFTLNTDTNPRTNEPQIPWKKYFNNQYRITNAYRYQLKNNAYMLDNYITILAREKYNNVIDNGFITIATETAREKGLNITLTEKTRLRDVKNDVINAVNDLNEITRAYKIKIIDKTTQQEFNSKNAELFFSSCELLITFTAEFIKDMNDTAHFTQEKLTRKFNRYIDKDTKEESIKDAAEMVEQIEIDNLF